MQGFNMGRYYPPDASNAPTFNTTSHPLGARARKLPQGILTVRFELPFAVWCSHCTPAALVGQGVRFNAEKKKVGNYHSTPIWAFRMKHSACGGWWEIRTDPRNSEYVVVEGGRRRDYGEGEGELEEEGEMRFLSEGERERRRGDAFAGLEGRREEGVRERGNKERVEELYEKGEVWRDPYEVNLRLRDAFRVKRKGWEREETEREGLREKYSLGLDIADEVESDGLRAGLVEFGDGGRGAEDVTRKPLFAEREIKRGNKCGHGTKLKAEVKAEKSRQDLQRALVGNTRAVVDPFLATGMPSSARLNLGIVKRKWGEDSPQKGNDILQQIEAGNEKERQTEGSEDEPPAKKIALPLVDYDSD